MSKTDALMALAGRCEAATGPGRDLDRLIDHHLVYASQPAFHLAMSLRDKWDVLHYTASMDAALTLVPKGWSWGMTYESERSDGKTFASVRRYWTSFDKDHFCWAATPALALCAAALRAMASAAKDPA